MGVTQAIVFKRALCLVYCSAIAVLKLAVISEQGALHFYFVLGSSNYVDGPG